MPIVNTGVKLGTNLYPQSASFPDGGQLGGLEVREAKRREITILLRERRKAINDHSQLRQNQSERFLEEDEICIASKRFDQISEQILNSNNVLGDIT